MGDYAYYNCSSLDGQFINSERIQYIGNSAFENCSSMTGSLILPETVTYLGSGAFKNCKNLNSILDFDLAQIDNVYYQTFWAVTT